MTNTIRENPSNQVRGMSATICRTCGVVHEGVGAAHRLTKKEGTWKRHFSAWSRLRPLQQQLHRKQRNQVTPRSIG